MTTLTTARPLNLTALTAAELRHMERDLIYSIDVADCYSSGDVRLLTLVQRELDRRGITVG